ncbi:hypothetical protein FRC14_000223 [Serendipita sp. 396]|nr:hypothetical protein FRC14_000223 [Serendipita sp. 396]KAG8863016.1 hypothetical protein FRC20_010949 [Serendipita sp. 405]
MLSVRPLLSRRNSFKRARFPVWNPQVARSFDPISNLAPPPPQHILNPKHKTWRFDPLYPFPTPEGRPRPPLLRPLRSATLRQCRAFQQGNRNINLEQQGHQNHAQGHDHQTLHVQHQHPSHPQHQSQHPQEEEEETEVGQDEKSPLESTNTAVQQERLPRRENYPGYAKYRYRDQLARQQEKWNRRDKKQAMIEERKNNSKQTKEREGKQSGSTFEVGSDGAVSGLSPNLDRSGKGKGKGKSKSDDISMSTQSPESSKRGGGTASGNGTRKCTNGRSRVTGADLYVARITRTGVIGNAMPCWRCLEWCKWAGIKRIFHYSVDVENSGALSSEDMNPSSSQNKENTGGRWVCVKVNEARPEDCYWTHGDGRVLGAYY